MPKAEDAQTVADTLARNVRAYRLLRGLDQDQVAGRMFIFGHHWRQSTVSEVERGLRSVTVPELVNLVIVLEATVTQLLDPRGPGGRKGPRLRLAVDPGFADLTRKAVVDPRNVTALVCDHELYVEADWYHGSDGEQGDALLLSVTFVDATGPEGAPE